MFIDMRVKIYKTYLKKIPAVILVFVFRVLSPMSYLNTERVSRGPEEQS